MTICIIGDEILLDGATVARLLPSVRLSQRDQLAEAFALAGENEETIAELEDCVERLEEQLKARLKETAR
jgi:hypothetical protein